MDTSYSSTRLYTITLSKMYSDFPASPQTSSPLIPSPISPVVNSFLFVFPETFTHISDDSIMNYIHQNTTLQRKAQQRNLIVPRCFLFDPCMQSLSCHRKGTQTPPFPTYRLKIEHFLVGLSHFSGPLLP